MKFIDVHGHINFAAYDVDREAVIKRARDAEVGMMTVGTQLDTSKSAIALAEANPDIWAIVGLHPVHTGKSHHDEAEFGKEKAEFTEHGEKPDLEAYRQLIENSRVVAVGEIGLDLFHSGEESFNVQKEIFEAMIGLANEADKPLMLHIRNSKDLSRKSAYMEAYDILKANSKVLGNLHFFAGNIDEARAFLDLGYYFSFTGAITFAKNYRELIEFIPIDRIQIETDCPFVAPVPHRGKRNEPAFVVEVAKKLAEIKKLDLEALSQQLLQNNCNFFKISF